MAEATKKLDIAKKYYVRKEDGTIDYDHPYDLIKEAGYKELYLVELDGHFGYMNADGKFVIPLEYDSTRNNYKGERRYVSSSWQCVTDEIAIVEICKNHKLGVANNHGEIVVPCEFEDVKIFSYDASPNFIPVALSNSDNTKLVWGLYDVKKKRVSVTPQYDEVGREWNGYASFKENEKWGLLHCSTGTVVAPAIYLLDFTVGSTGLAIAFVGGSWEYGRNTRYVQPEETRVLVVNGIDQAQVVISGYDWIERSGPSVVNCRIGKQYNPTREDSFKIIKMPNYIALIKNASYEEGYILKETGEFVKEWQIGCDSCGKQKHAKYVSGGVIIAKTYSGKEIPVTYEIMQEIQNKISRG